MRGCHALVAAHIGSAFALNELVLQNKMHCHCLPQGVIVNLWREIAAGRPGMITKVGLGTFVDPRNGGGKMNEVTTEDLVELIEFQGEEYLFYRSFPLDVALLRGTTADENGNISFEKDGFINEGLAIATAAHNSGGIVIVQVERVAKRGTLHPKQVKIPAFWWNSGVAKKQNLCDGRHLLRACVFGRDQKSPWNRIPRCRLTRAEGHLRGAARRDSGRERGEPRGRDADGRGLGFLGGRRSTLLRFPRSGAIGGVRGLPKLRQLV